MEHLAKCFRIDIEHNFWNKANNPAQNQLLNPRYMFSLAQGGSKLGDIPGNAFEEIPQVRNISLPQMEICFKFLKVHGNGWIVVSFQFSAVQLTQSDMSDFLWPHGLQHTRLPCPSPSLGACSNSCPLSRWCHPAISSSVFPFSRLQSFPASGSFHMSQFFISGGQSIGVLAPVSS